MKNKIIHQDVSGMKIVSDIVENERKFTIEFDVSEEEIKYELKKLTERNEDGEEQELSNDVYNEFVKELSFGYLRSELKRELIDGISFTLCTNDKMTPNYRVLKEWSKRNSGFHPIHGNLFKLGKLNGFKVGQKLTWYEDEERKVIKGK